MTDTHDRAVAVRLLNDALRELGVGGDVVLTGDLAREADDKPGLIAEIIRAVRAFDDFNEGNDPYGEHDFGSIDVVGEKINWKIEYFNADMTEASENPADAAVTKRFMSIFYARDY